MITALIITGSVILVAAVLGLITLVLVRDESGDPSAAVLSVQAAEGFGLPGLPPAPVGEQWWLKQDTGVPGRPAPDETPVSGPAEPAGDPLTKAKAAMDEVAALPLTDYLSAAADATAWEDTTGTFTAITAGGE